MEFKKLTHLKQKTKLFFILSFTLLLVACEDELPKLKGRYQGVQITGFQKVQVIAQMPDFSTVGKENVSIFKIYPTLVNAPGDQYSIHIRLDKKRVEFHAPQLLSGSLRLALHKNCATGSNESQDVSAC